MNGLDVEVDGFVDSRIDILYDYISIVVEISIKTSDLKDTHGGRG